MTPKKAYYLLRREYRRQLHLDGGCDGRAQDVLRLLCPRLRVAITARHDA